MCLIPVGEIGRTAERKNVGRYNGQRSRNAREIRTINMQKTAPQDRASPSSSKPVNFDDLYHEYGERILNMAYRMTGSEETARDLTQDIFLKVYEKMDTFRGDANVYTWLYRVAVNHILNHLQRIRRKQWLNLLDKSVSELLAEDRVDPTFVGNQSFPSPEKTLEKQEREKIVWSIVQTLPPKYRVPLVLYRYEGLSYREIADTMNISLSAVETRIHRARKQLIKKLQPWIEHL